MARVLRCKEKLMLACMSVFFTVSQAWPLGTMKTSRHYQGVHSRLVTGIRGKNTLGVEVMVRKPYVRLVRASLAPVALPLAAGAYVAMAASGSYCPACTDTAGRACCLSLGTTTCCDHFCRSTCWTVPCQNFEPGSDCVTCGHGTCPASCTL